MISSTAWVPRGFAAEFPQKYELDDAEMDRITSMAKLQLQDSETPPKSKLQQEIDIDDNLKEYDLENYDQDDDEGSGVPMLPGLSATDAKYHDNSGEDSAENDPYLSLPNEEDENQDRQESQIYPSDNLILATRTEDEVSYLDVFVYDDGADSGPTVDQGFVRDPSLYVHHDLMLPAFPLCVEWINYKPGLAEDSVANYAAIGTFDPQIEIWNLDCIDNAFPDVILGEPDQNSFSGVSKKKKNKSASAHVTTHHTDAVLSLSHNRLHRQVLASASADHSVKLWDLNEGAAVRSFQIHNNKTVSSARFHPSQGSILLTGGYDGACGVSDVRMADATSMTKRYQLTPAEDVENVSWGFGDSPEMFYCGTEGGNVHAFDLRSTEKPLWSLHAHDAGISSLDANRFIPGLLSTSAMGEKEVKLWKCPVDGSSGPGSEGPGSGSGSGSGASGPSMVLSRDFDVGNVLSTSFANDIEVAGNLAVGGVNGGLKLWDCLGNRSVRGRFGRELKQLQQQARQQSGHSRIAKKYQGEGESTVIEADEGSDEESDEE